MLVTSPVKVLRSYKWWQRHRWLCLHWYVCICLYTSKDKTFMMTFALWRLFLAHGISLKWWKQSKSGWVIGQMFQVETSTVLLLLVSELGMLLFGTCDVASTRCDFVCFLCDDLSIACTMRTWLSRVLIDASLVMYSMMAFWITVAICATRQ